MKQLSKHELSGVVRDIDEAGHLTAWLIQSRDENRELLEGAAIEDVEHLQGQNSTINQILDKITDKV